MRIRFGSLVIVVLSDSRIVLLKLAELVLDLLDGVVLIGWR